MKDVNFSARLSGFGFVLKNGVTVVRSGDATVSTKSHKGPGFVAKLISPYEKLPVMIAAVGPQQDANDANWVTVGQNFPNEAMEAMLFHGPHLLGRPSPGCAKALRITWRGSRS